MERLLTNEDEIARLIALVFLQPDQKSRLEQMIVKNDTDWKKTIGLILEHKLLSISVPVLRDVRMGKKFPQVINTLIRQKKIRVNRKELLLNELKRVTLACKLAGIPTLSYKGQILAHKYYESPHLRDSVDVDLAIEEKNLAKSFEVMQSLGYELIKDEGENVDIEKMRSYDIDFSWVLRDEEGNIKINTEFHWQPSHNVLWVPLKFSDIINDTTQVELDGRKLQSFEEIIHIVIVIIHHGIVDGWGKLRHLVDLTVILRAMSAEDIAALSERAKQHKVLNAFLVGVELARNIFEIELAKNLTVPKEMKALANDMEPEILENRLSGKWSDQKKKLIYYIKMRDSFQDKIKSLWVFSKFYFSDKKHKKGKSA